MPQPDPTVDAQLMAEMFNESQPVRRRHPVRRVLMALFAVLVIVAAFVIVASPIRADAAAVQVATYDYGLSPSQHLDAYLDLNAEQPKPWVMVIHGGSWSGGEIANTRPTAEKLAAAGFAVFNVEYRRTLAGPDRAQWPAQREDVQDAFKWVQASSEAFNIDPDRGAIYGFSAGGHIAASVAARESAVRAVVTNMGPNQPRRVLAVANAKTTYDGDKSTVATRQLADWAIVATGCPRLDWTVCRDRWDDFTPDKHWDNTDPPVLVVKGGLDTVIPNHDSFAYWVTQRGGHATTMSCPTVGHSEKCALDGGRNQAKAMAFLKTNTGAAS